MSLSSSQLDAFIAVAQELSFTKAALKLHVTQSALSQRILNLEDELETTLFIREKSGLNLTEIGLELLRHCQTRSLLEDNFLSTIKSKTNSLSGTLRIAGFSSVMRSVILPSLGNILRENPEMRSSFLIREFRDLPGLLKRSEVDFVITDRVLDLAPIESRLLGYEENFLVRSKKQDLPDVFLDNDEEDQTTIRYFELTGKKFKFKRRYLDEVYSLIDGVSAGLGRAILPRHLVAERKDLEILYPKVSLKVPVFLNFYSQPYYSSLHQSVVESLEKNASGFLKSR